MLPNVATFASSPAHLAPGSWLLHLEAGGQIPASDECRQKYGVGSTRFIAKKQFVYVSFYCLVDGRYLFINV